MNLSKAQKRDNKLKKRGKNRPMNGGNRSVFTIQDEQIKRARKIKEERECGE